MEWILNDVIGTGHVSRMYKTTLVRARLHITQTQPIFKPKSSTNQLASISSFRTMSSSTNAFTSRPLSASILDDHRELREYHAVRFPVTQRSVACRLTGYLVCSPEISRR